MTGITTQAPSAVLVELTGGQITTTSLDVAAHFHKRHERVLDKIRNLDCSPEFTAHNFVLSEYTDSTGRTLPQYRLTRDGFTFLCMGFTGKEAARWKEAYIEAFNRMEALLRASGLPEIHYPVARWLEEGPQRPKVLGEPEGLFVTADLFFDLRSPTLALLGDLHRAGYTVDACFLEVQALRHHLEVAREFMRETRNRAEAALSHGTRFQVPKGR